MNDKGRPRLKAVAAASGIHPGTIRKYADLGLIDAKRDHNNNWLFTPQSAAQAVAVRAQRAAASVPRPLAHRRSND
jgi:DNA-binding transcriptional MerR regulator